MSFLRDMAMAILLLENGKREQSRRLMMEIVCTTKSLGAWGALEEEMMRVYLEEVKRQQHTLISSLLHLTI